MARRYYKEYAIQAISRAHQDAFPLEAYSNLDWTGIRWEWNEDSRDLF
jgi:hypothetical protein